MGRVRPRHPCFMKQAYPKWRPCGKLAIAVSRQAGTVLKGNWLSYVRGVSVLSYGAIIWPPGKLDIPGPGPGPGSAGLVSSGRYSAHAFATFAGQHSALQVSRVPSTQAAFAIFWQAWVSPASHCSRSFGRAVSNADGCCCAHPDKARATTESMTAVCRRFMRVSPLAALACRECGERLRDC